MSRRVGLSHFFASLDTDSALYEESNLLRPYAADPMHAATLPRNYAVHDPSSAATWNDRILYSNLNGGGAATVGRVGNNHHIVHGGRHFASLEKSKAQRYSRSEYHLMDQNNEFTDYDTIQRQEPC
ncbi:hypothetical protein B9Z55_012646 [Caenorhabditis nigoni]|uniref:Uncharacterized protein n=1 Tax=Caenorhabditis nigoni TaxID=1611254 RepID=A0A2G5TY74_9PELO|nr:hypothetical protein B9Z55_012646 [Caenorhabditis nigoni]